MRAANDSKSLDLVHANKSRACFGFFVKRGADMTRKAKGK